MLVKTNLPKITFLGEYNNYPKTARAQKLIPEGDSFIYFSDFHSNISKFPNVSGLIKQIDSESGGEKVLKICAGDLNFGKDGKNLSLVAKIFNKIGIDIATLGNHEFDMPLSLLRKSLNKFKAHFLAVNIDNSKAKLPVNPSEIVNLNNNKYGIIGVAKDSDQDLEKGLMNLEDTVKKVQKQLNDFAKQGIDKIILVSHLGFNNDKALCENTTGIDIVVSSHSHLAINGVKRGINVFNTKGNEPFVILQAAKDNNYLGFTRFSFDSKGVLSSIYNKLFSTNAENVQKDKEVEKMVSEKYSSEIISKSGVNLSIDDINYRECKLGNWIADTINNSIPEADIALIPSRIIRSGLRKGEISSIDLKEMLPERGSKANESFVVLKLSKEEIMTVLNGLNNLEENERGTCITHISGGSYVVGENKKVKSIKIKSDKEKYNVAIPNFILTKMNLCKMVGLEKQEISLNTGRTAYDIVSDYLKTNTLKSEPVLENRIIIEFEVKTKEIFTKKMNDFIQF